MFKTIVKRFNNELTKEQQLDVLNHWNVLMTFIKVMDGVSISEIRWRRNGVGVFTYEDAYVSEYVIRIGDKYRIDNMNDLK